MKNKFIISGSGFKLIYMYAIFNFLAWESTKFTFKIERKGSLA